MTSKDHFPIVTACKNDESFVINETPINLLTDLEMVVHMIRKKLSRCQLTKDESVYLSGPEAHLLITSGQTLHSVLKASNEHTKVLMGILKSKDKQLAECSAIHSHYEPLILKLLS